MSVSSTGAQANGESFGGGQVISSSGRYVAFTSSASDVVEGDTNGFPDAFVHDRVTGLTRRVSVGPSGEQANGSSQAFAVSADGRFIAFASDATNLVANDTNRRLDLFVRDLKLGVTERVSVGRNGRQANGVSSGTAMSPDGRYIAFISRASTLTAGDTNGTDDVFLRDRATGTTQLVTAGIGGQPANNNSYWATVSADGRLVAFSSFASNLVVDDHNITADVFVRDVAGQTTRRVSVGVSGQESNGESGYAQLSADGRSLAFESLASNLVPGDTNQINDVFVRDLSTGANRRVTVGPQEQQTDAFSMGPAISADGRFVVFLSLASTLVPGDDNGLPDLFRRDLVAGTTRRLSAHLVNEASDSVALPAISADGREVEFTSAAADLVPGDTNGDDVFVWDEGGRGDGPFCTMTGTAGDDRLVGTPGPDVICAGAGDDVVYGGGGRDVILGGTGDDTLRGGVGADLVDGGPGADVVRGDNGDDVLTGGGGPDILIGGEGSDAIDGEAGADKLTGGAGIDSCVGGTGADTATTCESG